MAYRDPDEATRYTTFPGEGDPIVLDVDPGAQFDGSGPSDEQSDRWKESMLTAYDSSGLSRGHAAFAAYEDAVDTGVAGEFSGVG